MADRPLTIVLLGPLRIERVGVAVRELTSAQSRALLTCLILSDAPVERGLLCGLFWPDVPEARARLSLRVALTRLRAALPGRIHADRYAVAFVAQTDDDVDTQALRPLLEALAAPAATQRDGDAVQAAIDRLRGPVAADLDHAATDDFRAWLAERRADWDALVSAALARLAKADLAMGGTLPQVLPDAGKAAMPVGTLGADVDPSAPWPPMAAQPAGGGWLGEALRRNPVAESLSRRLMLDLARQGDHTAALAEHSRLTAALGAQLGLRPDGETEGLRDRIVAARVRQRRHNLPQAPADRASSGVDAGPTTAKARLAAWLVDPDRRLVSLIGAPGPVRSRLARDAALLAVNSLLDGILWVPRRGGTAEGFPIAQRLASALVQLDGAAPPVERIGDYLAPLDRLVVIDSIDEEPGAVDALACWLEAAPTPRWLVLSAAPLGFFFEHRFRLAG